MDAVNSDRGSLRTAEIIAVGSELLGWTRLDTNSLFLSERLASLGIELAVKMVVGDDRDRLAAVFTRALDRADLVVLTGGLGPTDDDVTREAVASVLGRPLVEDPAIVERIERRFARRGLRMPDVNRRQALVPRGATVLENANGTAPGLLIDTGSKLVVLLPGPPRELQPMMEALVNGALAARAGAERLHRRVLLITGRTESHVEEAVQPIYSRWRAADTPIETTILASPGQIELHLTARSTLAETADAALAAATSQILGVLGDDVFSTNGLALEEVVGNLLREKRLTIGVAESCTGGLLLSRLTDIAGSSEYVLGGVVAYSNAAKTAFLEVPPDLIAAHGAVSEPVAVAMAEGIRSRTDAHVGVGVTGIAGPGGGSLQKPVGTVAVAAVGPDGLARARTLLFPGGRSMVKFQASQAGLDLVRKMIAPVRRD
jgi:competence/damage-inducible protein CinA-like protein